MSKYRLLPNLGLGFVFGFVVVTQTLQMYFIDLLLLAEPAARLCALDRSSYSRSGQDKSTAEANYFLFHRVVRNGSGALIKTVRVKKDIDVSRSDLPDNFRLVCGRRLDKAEAVAARSRNALSRRINMNNALTLCYDVTKTLPLSKSAGDADACFRGRCRM